DVSYNSLPSSILHGDLSLGNVKWEGSSIIALYDWEKARSSQPRIGEFKNTLLAGGKGIGRKYSRENLIAMLKGYQLYTQNKLSRKELESIPNVLGVGTFGWDAARWFILSLDTLNNSSEKADAVEKLMLEFSRMMEDFNKPWWQETVDLLTGESLRRVLLSEDRASRLGIILAEGDIIDVQLNLMHLFAANTYRDPEIRAVLSDQAIGALLSKALAVSLRRSDAKDIAVFLKELISDPNKEILPEAKMFIDSYLTVFNIQNPLEIAVCISLWGGQAKYPDPPLGRGWLSLKTEQFFGELLSVNHLVQGRFVFVNDGDDKGYGQTNTLEVLRGLITQEKYADLRKRIYLYSLSQIDKLAMSSVKHGALAAGMQIAADQGADIIMYTDGDPSAHLGLAGLLINGILNQGNDLVWGSICKRGALASGRKLIRRVGTYGFNLWVRFLYKNLRFVQDNQRSFKALSRSLVKRISPLRVLKADDQGLLRLTFDRNFVYGFAGDVEWLGRAAVLGYKLKEIPIAWHDSPETSTLNFWSSAFSMGLSVLRSRIYLNKIQNISGAFQGFFLGLLRRISEAIGISRVDSLVRFVTVDLFTLGPGKILKAQAGRESTISVALKDLTWNTRLTVNFINSDKQIRALSRLDKEVGKNIEAKLVYGLRCGKDKSEKPLAWQGMIFFNHAYFLKSNIILPQHGLLEIEVFLKYAGEDWVGTGKRYIDVSGNKERARKGNLFILVLKKAFSSIRLLRNKQAIDLPSVAGGDWSSAAAVKSTDSLSHGSCVVTESSNQAYPAYMYLAGGDSLARKPSLGEFESVIDYLGGINALMREGLILGMDQIIIDNLLSFPAEVENGILRVNPNTLRGPAEQLRAIFSGHEFYHLANPGLSEERVRERTLEYLRANHLLSSHIRFLENNTIGLSADLSWLNYLKRNEAEEKLRVESQRFIQDSLNLLRIWDNADGLNSDKQKILVEEFSARLKEDGYLVFNGGMYTLSEAVFALDGLIEGKDLEKVRELIAALSKNVGKYGDDLGKMVIFFNRNHNNLYICVMDKGKGFPASNVHPLKNNGFKGLADLRIYSKGRIWTQDKEAWSDLNIKSAASGSLVFCMYSLNAENELSRISEFIKAIRLGVYQDKAVVDLRKAPDDFEIIIVGDLHGRVDRFDALLSHRRKIVVEGKETLEDSVLEKIRNKKAALFILGDAVHATPDVKVEMGDFIKWAKAGVKRDDLEGLVVDLYSNPDSSIALMRRIMDLKINNPDNFYYILGNHDLINYHWSKRGPCGFIIDQSIPYREALEQRFGSKYLDLYRKFVEASPVLLLADDLIATHAGPIKGSFNSQKLKNLPTTNLKNPILVNLLMGRFCGYSHKGEEAFSYSQEDLNSFIGSLGYDIKDCWFIVGHTPTQEGFFKRVLFNHYLISGCEREFGYFSYRKNKGEFVAVQDNGSSHLPPSSVNLVGVDRGPTVKMNAGICFGRFNEGIKLCKISKVPVKLHWSFFIVLALAAGNGLFSLAFLLSIFTLVTLHEFAHIKAAAKYGIGTIQVLLTALGGVATLESCGFTPRQQRKIASAGPLFNLFLAVVLFLLLFSIAPFEAWHFGLSSWFGLLVSISYANLMLGLFNLLPVFPLDGGRIFRSLMISSFGLDRIRATELTLKLSRVFALGFIVLPFLLGSYPVLFAIGVFILVSAPGQAKSAGYSHPVSSTEMRMAADKFIGEPKVAEGFLKLSEALGVLEDYIASSGKINGPPVNKQMLLGDIDTSSVVAWRSNPGKVIWNLDTTNIKRILLPTKFSGQFVIEQIHIHESGKDEDDAISSQAQFLRSDNPLKLLALKFLKETGELIKTIDDRFDPLKCFIHGKPKGDDSVFLENRVLAYAEFVRSFGIFEPSYPYFYQIIEDVFLNGAAVLMYAKGSDQVYACLNELRLNIEVMSFLLRHDCLDSLKECWISSERIALPTSLVVKILGIRESLAGKHIFGKGIKEWAGSHGLFLKQHPRFYPIPGENEQYAYDIRVYTTKGYACRTLKSVEAFILSEAGRVGETVGVTRWINNLKRAALNNGKPQIEFLLGRNGPFYWAARIHAFERCRLAHLKRLFGIVDISDTSLDKLPIWPVDNNGYIRADLIDWISQDNGIPPAQYYEVEKFSLEQLPKFKTTDLITGFNGLAFMPLALSFFSGLNSEFSWEGVIFTGILTFFLLYFGKAYLFFKSRSRNETEERKSPIHLTDPMTPRIEDISNPAEKKKAIFNIYKPVAVDERGNYIFGVVPVSEDEEYVWDSTLPQVRDRSDLQAASFLRKKGAVNPEIIEVLGQLKDYLYIDNAPDYLKEEIARQEQEGVKFLVARLDNALATSYRGKETYLSNVLFNPKYPAPLGLIYMYIRHEAKKHSNLKSEAEAVRREVDAYNSLSSEERGKVKNWGDWYVRELERRGLDRAKNIINYSFFELARKIQDNPDSLFLEDHFVIAHYGEIHLKKRFEFEKRLYSFFVIVIFSICFIPVLLGYSHVVMAVTGFFSCALIYFIFCRYLGAIHLKYFALDSSLADDYKKVVSGMPNEGRVYIKNLLQVINAYKYHPSWRYAQARVRIITLHFLSQIVQLQSFGEKTELELAPKGALVRSPVRSNVASLMLIEHLLASTEETFSEPAWVSLVKVVAENRDRWLGPVLSVMSSAVHISYCADNLVKLLYKADNKQLDRYKIKDIEAFRNSLYELIILLAQEHKDFKCQAILCLCDSIQHGRGNETIFAVNLLRELKFHIVEASNFSMVSSDVASGIIKDIIEKSGHANIAFGAGSTITKPYQYGPRSIPSFAEHLSLRKQDFNWDEQVKAWQLSEYASLDSGHPFSQAYALKESLFSRIFNAVENNVSFIGDSPDPRGYVEKQNQAGGIDLIISGVGADGHFGYNFPGTTADPSSAGRLVKVRLTPEVMSSSHESYPDIEKNPFAWTLGLADIIKPTAVKKPQVIVLVLGKKKAQMLRESLEEADSPLAKIIRELDTTIIVADEAVHSLIPDYLQRCSAAMRSIYGKEKNKYYSIDLAVHMIDNKGNIVWVNRAWEKLFGFSEEQVIGQPVWFFVNEENQVVSEARVKDKLSKRIENLPD
ncbi:MAG: site-2 protease family protein, partial [Candidatus Omnitrophota bacterium]